MPGIPEVSTAQLIRPGEHGQPRIRVDDAAIEWSAARRHIRMSPEVSELRPLTSHAEYRGRARDFIPTGSCRLCMLSQPHVAQGGLQSFPDNPPIPQPHSVDTRVAIRTGAIADSIDNEDAHARQRQEALAHPFIRDRRRHHNERVIVLTPRVCVHGTEADQGLSGTAFRDDRGCARFIPPPQQPANCDQLCRIGLRSNCSTSRGTGSPGRYSGGNVPRCAPPVRGRIFASTP